MSKDSKPVDMPDRRLQRLIFGFVLGVAITAIAMGFLWSSYSTEQEETIRALSSQISEKDATINTLYSQLSEQDKGSKSSDGGRLSGGQP